MNIKMVDTVGQYQKIKPEIDAAISGLLEKGFYIGGAAVKQFEQNLGKYVGVSHTISCANGTDALQIALMAIGCKPGDEVLTPSFTYIATVEVIALLQLVPVFVEVHADTFNIDVADLEKKITPKTKAIIPVHLYGQSADMEAVMAVAQQHNLAVIEDAAQAIGADYTFSDGTKKKVGSIGHIGCTSFYPSKNLGAYGDGGAIFTNDAALAESIRMICNHGQKTRYYHDSIGVNSRLDAIQAAVLDIKLTHLDEYNAARRWAASRYDAHFAQVSELVTPFCAANGGHVFHQYTLKVLAGREKRDALKAFLDSKNIPAMIYYPVPSHLQTGYTCYGYKTGDMPHTEELTAQVISLAMHTELTETEIMYIVSHVIEGLK